MSTEATTRAMSRNTASWSSTGIHGIRSQHNTTSNDRSGNGISVAEPTLPVWVWNQKRFGLTPAVNAIFTLIGVATLVLVLVAQRLVLVQRLPQQ